MEALSIVIPVVVSVIVLASFIPVFIFLRKFMKRQAEGARLQQTGLPAQGQIVSAQETGTRINDQPEVLLTLNVQRPGHPPYQAQATAIISSLMIPRIQPGMTVGLKVDPANPARVGLDMAALHGGAVAAPGYAGMAGAMGAGMSPQAAAMAANPYAAAAAGHAAAAQAGAYAAQQSAVAHQQYAQQAAAAGYNPQAAYAQAAAQAPMAGVNPYGMSQDQLMAMAHQAAAMPPAGGAILTCAQCGNPYASANPRCPNCGAAKPA